MKRVTLVVVTLVIYIIVANGLTYAGDQGILSKLFLFLGVKFVNPGDVSDNGSDVTLDLKSSHNIIISAVDPLPKPPVIPDSLK